MNRQYFMNELSRRLSVIPQAERDAALLFYDELFDEAGPDKEWQVIEEHGSPYQVAAKILAEFAADQTLNSNSRQTDYHGSSPYSGYRSPTKRISWLWYLILGIMAAPVAIPVAAAAFAVIMSVVVALFALILSLGVTVLAWFISSVVLFATGVYTIFFNPPIGITMVGVSLLMVALALLIFIPVSWLLVFAVDLVTKGAAWTFSKIRGGKRI